MPKTTKKLLGEKARIKLKQGIDLVADYVKLTLGPKGRNIAFNQFGPLPTRAVNDGVTIAKEIKDEDPFIQAGIEMVQEICEKTNNNAGDGTSQTALLAQAIINEGNKRLVAGFNPMVLKKELEDDCKNLISELDNLSTPVKNSKDIKNIATIAGNNDEEIGKAIAEISDKVGMNASILIEKGNAESIKIETVKGMYFDKGYRVPAFINNYDRGIAEYNNPNIFLVNSPIRWNDEINDFFNKCLEHKILNVVIIAHDIEGEALNTLAISNKDKYTPQPKLPVSFEILGIEAPYVGPDREEVLEDIAIYTGGKIINNLDEVHNSKMVGSKEIIINSFDEVAGSCDRIVSSLKTTTLMGGKGTKKAIEERVKTIKQQIEQKFDREKVTKEKLEERRDMLDSGVGIIYAGGTTEIEMKDRYLRLEDAVRASKSALKEGYVAGGGQTYLTLSRLAKTDILQNALKEVMKQVVKNAGAVPEQIVEKCLEKDNMGWNAKTAEFGDLIKMGVIDATLVLKNALRNAVSLAGLFLTTEGLICECDIPIKEK